MLIDAAPEATTLDAPIGQAGATADHRVFAEVEITSDAARIGDAWQRLLADAPATLYQTPGFQLAWSTTIGAHEGLSPLFVVARDAARRPVLLLPLARAQRAGLSWATFAGGRESNINLPLVATPAAWTASEIKRLLLIAGRRADIDLFLLRNQPARWNGAQNPLLLLPHQRAPSDGYGTHLPSDIQDLFVNKLSKEARRKLRKKEASLAASAPLVHVIATDPLMRDRILGAFFAQKSARFAARGLPSPFASAAVRDFLVQASASGAIELHALRLGERIVAVYGGGAHRGHWSGLVNSFDADPAIAKASPGDLLLMRVIADAARRGLTSLDLGIGAARYKASLCDEPIALHDSFVPVSVRGRIAATAAARLYAIKAQIKARPRLHAIALKAAHLRR